eukprot:CAMPEP_0205925308 /NCGR_PEP_ID=MMETSP1325-20131115/17958_1 /ASSEMBLY_ACC=CAM_ASM_000708 /TAXON_ID=236786 /ORGANISM="Florenciella sp., Strain RCC1007" /LENGTH=60 /DNA_ID=CAMNT_0053293821 /DNA_START=56 /DNA_END=234 /DNA_ORIENTATION=-
MNCTLPSVSPFSAAYESALALRFAFAIRVDGYGRDRTQLATVSTFTHETTAPPNTSVARR